jgi:multidrug efflux pump subunit AcrA (membrane-fusion protein)
MRTAASDHCRPCAQLSATVQRLEGGIIREILIRDGEAVKEGQVLVRLDNTDALTPFVLVAGQVAAYYLFQVPRRLVQHDEFQ